MSTAIIVSQVRGISNKSSNIQCTTTSTNKCSVTACKATIDNRNIKSSAPIKNESGSINISLDKTMNLSDHYRL